MSDQAELLAKALKPAEEALRLHAYYKGKMQTLPKCAIRGLEDFSIWYTPGVAAPCKAIQADRELVYEYTNKANTIAVVSDGTRVLGLGDIGPEAGLPVMEGKALLFKYMGGVDAVPICLDTKDPDELIRTVRLLAPSFGAINLEDIAMPKCFRILRELQATSTIPVWHDDQQGTGTVLLAGLINALTVVGKDISQVRIAMIGMGAANVPTYRFITASGADPSRILACDAGGILGQHRQEYEQDPAF
ncbi:MAG: NAD(P)-dependent malic enzyme, partial [Nitrospira sp.]